MGEHLHPGSHERFSVLEGELTVVRNGRRSVLRAGESAHIEPGVWHDWWNEAQADAVVHLELAPGERFVHMSETLFGSRVRDTSTPRQRQGGMPNPLQLALTAHEFSDVMVFRKPPRAVQRIVFGALAPIANDAATAPPTRASRARRWRRGQRTLRPADHPGPAAAPDRSEQRRAPPLRSFAAALGQTSVFTIGGLTAARTTSGSARHGCVEGMVARACERHMPEVFVRGGDSREVQACGYLIPQPGSRCRPSRSCSRLGSPRAPRGASALR
jgi:hypothetical protein